ncbi:SIR2 family protein [Serratia quinivorans]|uniref:SIR2 family protein n=1 Tax=Serratia quinivorans TaxID=137545 RepID=UPI00398253BB
MDFSIPQQLKDAIKEKNLVLFIGAGFSRNCGFPDWKDIVIEILEENKKYIEKASSFISALNDDVLTPLEALDKVKGEKKIILNGFEQILKGKKNNSDIHKALSLVSKKIITTNFDKLLESNVGIDTVITQESDFNLSKIDTSNEFIVKLHGDVSEIDKCIIFTEQFDRLYKSDKLATFQLKKIFSQYSVLFIGFSFNDPYVTELFEYVSNLLDGYGPKHYILSADDVSLDNVNTINIKSYDNLSDYIISLGHENNLSSRSKEETKKDERYVIIDGSDIPPDVSSWVGREKELNILEGDSFKVIFITGIGGEGKSSLASYYLTSSQSNGAYEIYDWRDFKEEDHKFQQKILSMMKLVSPIIELSEFAGLNDDILIAHFFRILADKKCMFILDNVDSYIDLERFEPVNGIGKLLAYAIKSDHKSKFIFTCRPLIHYANVDFYQLNLSGLNEKNTIDYFLQGKIPINRDKLIAYAKSSYTLTNGHALWLSLIVAQARRGESNLVSFLDGISSGVSFEISDSSILSEKVLGSIWKNLHIRDRQLLRTLAESVRPETSEAYAEILRSELNFKNFQKAINALRNLNLIINKRGTNFIELHPLVKEFVRKSQINQDRNKFIRLYISYYDKFVLLLKEKLSHELSFEEFSNFTNKAELSINAEEYQDAINTLWEVHSVMSSAGYLEEFLRVAKKLFNSLTWSKNSISKFDNFEPLLSAVSRSSVNYGDDIFNGGIIEKYESIIESKEESYIRLCSMKAYAHWFNGNADEAIDICEEALYFLDRANQPDKYSIRYDLALAQRDSGRSDNIDKALLYFSNNADINRMTNVKDDEFSNGDDDNGPRYGNVGKCLMLQGRVNDALVCFYKSFYLVNKRHDSARLLNVGYASSWISDALFDKGDFITSLYFHRYSIDVWKKASPSMSNKRNEKTEIYNQNLELNDIINLDEWRIEKYCRAFIESEVSVKF